MSVLGKAKPTAYANHGLILRVHKNNILTTSPYDQWFDNHAGSYRELTEGYTSAKASGQTLAEHTAEKNMVIGGLLTPDEVIAEQGTGNIMSHFAGAAATAHNEIVVCGIPNLRLPHGMTAALGLLGVFLQINMDGTFPLRYRKSQGAPADIDKAVRDYAVLKNVPLLYLPTNDPLA